MKNQNYIVTYSNGAREPQEVYFQAYDFTEAWIAVMQKIDLDFVTSVSLNRCQDDIILRACI
jgi:ABC-type branched-subunit amino acid transport system substrate-binding protein